MDGVPIQQDTSYVRLTGTCLWQMIQEVAARTPEQKAECCAGMKILLRRAIIVSQCENILRIRQEVIGHALVPIVMDYLPPHACVGSC
jgi:hypothetical protein